MGSDAHVPLRTLRYSLTPADNLAYEMLPGRLSFKTKFWLLVWIGCGGLLVMALPDSLAGNWWWAVAGFILAVWAVLAIVGTNIQVRRAAAARTLPAGPVEVEDQGAALQISSDGLSKKISFPKLGAVVLSPGHVFIDFNGGPLIIPLSAFHDIGEMQSYAFAVRERKFVKTENLAQAASPAV
jgi:hypothetical protein